MAPPSYVYDLLASEQYARWGADQPVGTPVTITYSFPTSPPSSKSYPNFTPFTATEIEATYRALDYISSLTNITFVETSSAGAQLQFGNGDLSSLGAWVSGRADYNYNFSSGIQQATVFLSNTGQGSLANSQFEPGSITANDIGGQGWRVLLHEIGHALGLKHPFETNIAGDQDSVMPSSVDDYIHTIMSYTPYQPSNVAVVTGNQSSYSYRAAPLNPDGYSIYDIAALQYLYGADTTSAGNKVFAFSPNDPVFTTIYDSGANNTIDASALTGSCRIDLNEGATSDLAITQDLAFPLQNFQSPYDGTSALTIAYGSKIANCIGGSGDDQITGNDLANRLDGSAGADTLIGGRGNDRYWVDNAGDEVVESGGGGRDDTVYSSLSYQLGSYIENLVLTGADAIEAVGNGHDNKLTGNAANNVIRGGQGVDTMRGLAGNDTYYIDNLGDTVLEVGLGIDTVRSTVSWTLGDKTEKLILGGTAAIDGTGNAAANRIEGNSAANRIEGGSGRDLLTGNAGADTFVFHPHFGYDTITDFAAGDAPGHDSIQIDKSIFASFGDLMAHTTDGAKGAVINVSAGTSIVLSDVQKANLTAADFTFV